MSGKIGAVILGLCLIIGIPCLFICTEKIPAGYEGVVYSMSGGIQDETLKQGWHIVSPAKKVKLFTISNEQLILSKDKREGSKTNEAFKVSTSDDANIAISFQMTYKFKPDQLTDTYKKFRGMDGEDIIDNRVKTVLKSKISEVTTNYSMMDIYSGNRSKINNEIIEYLNKRFRAEYGIDVLDASIIDVHPDKKLKEAIDNRVTALQQKQQAKAEQEKVKVEAETKLIKAENEAKVDITKAEAEAKSNQIVSKSITPELIKMKEAEARLKHGWVEIQGISNAIVDTNKKGK